MSIHRQVGLVAVVGHRASVALWGRTWWVDASAIAPPGSCDAVPPETPPDPRIEAEFAALVAASDTFRRSVYVPTPRPWLVVSADAEDASAAVEALQLAGVPGIAVVRPDRPLRFDPDLVAELLDARAACAVDVRRAPESADGWSLEAVAGWCLDTSTPRYGLDLNGHTDRGFRRGPPAGLTAGLKTLSGGLIGGWVGAMAGVWPGFCDPYPLPETTFLVLPISVAAGTTLGASLSTAHRRPIGQAVASGLVVGLVAGAVGGTSVALVASGYERYEDKPPEYSAGVIGLAFAAPLASAALSAAW